MLFLLTGAVQMGKTRWLEQLVVELAAEGVPCCGVLAPGVWRRREEVAAEGGEDVEAQPVASGAGDFEKLGIDNVLLPGGERVTFARRRDVAQREGALNPHSQSAAAGLAWEIDEAALVRVNAHFDALAHSAPFAPFSAPSPATSNLVRLRLLVVDELGRLELRCNGGLTSAMTLLARGATAACPHALVVVRESLRAIAEERFAAAWGGCVPLAPGDEARATVRRAFGLASLNDN